MVRDTSVGGQRLKITCSWYSMNLQSLTAACPGRLGFVEIGFTMVELYLNAKLHSRISEAAYRSLLTLKDLDDQDLKLRSDLMKQVDNGSIRLT
jgi:hypothetical protein